MDDNPAHQLIDRTGVAFTNCIWGNRTDIEEGNAGPMLESLALLLTPENAVRYRQRVMIGVRGYDDDARELFQIPEVRSWMQEVHGSWPYWFFFCEPGPRSSLVWIALCLSEVQRVPGGSTAGAGFSEFLSLSFWGLNQICDYIGDSEETNMQMTQSVLETLGLETDP